jgi:hypothetical protein
MWTSCTILFTTVLISNADSDDPRLNQITDIVLGVQQHFNSGCVSLIISSAPEGKRERERERVRETDFDVRNRVTLTYLDVSGVSVVWLQNGVWIWGFYGGDYEECRLPGYVAG